jgi:hypothetical protein
MFKRVGLSAAALVAAITLVQAPAASAQNRDNNSYDYPKAGAQQHNEYGNNRYAAPTIQSRGHSDTYIDNYAAMPDPGHYAVQRNNDREQNMRADQRDKDRLQFTVVKRDWRRPVGNVHERSSQQYHAAGWNGHNSYGR